VRALNAIENGGSVTVFVNSGSANGSQNFDQSSSYLFLNGGASTFTFTLSSYPSNPYPTVSHTLTNGQYYTVVAFGRADVGATDLRYPSLIVLDDDNVAVPTGDALVRIVNAAPDGGTTSVTIGATSVATNLAYGTATSYVAVPAGAGTLATTLSSGTAVPPQQVTLNSGGVYTFVVDETTIPPLTASTPVAYAVVGLGDQ
jgi:hypothetical protein